MKFSIWLSIIFSIHCWNSFPQRFAVIGDFGSGDDNEKKVADLVKSWNPEFVITLGDNNYYEGSVVTLDTNIGRFYSDFIFPYYGTFGTSGYKFNRFFPSLGNHDAYNNNLEVYCDYFTLPGNERYYDFEKGLVHFFVLNSNPSESDGCVLNSQQAEWLKDQVIKSDSRWKIVYFHHAPYSSGYHGNSEWMQWPFDKMGVNVVLSGHDHDYERLMINSLTYIVNGCGGAALRDFGPVRDESCIRYCEDFGAQLVETYSDSIIFNFININDSLIDHYVLLKHPGRYVSNNITRAIQENFDFYPNPFNGKSTIKVTVNDQSDIKLMAFDSSGRPIKIFTEQSYSPGIYYYYWRDGNLKAGVYYLVLINGEKILYKLVTKLP